MRQALLTSLPSASTCCLCSDFSASADLTSMSAVKAHVNWANARVSQLRNPSLCHACSCWQAQDYLVSVNCVDYLGSARHVFFAEAFNREPYFYSAAGFHGAKCKLASTIPGSSLQVSALSLAKLSVRTLHCIHYERVISGEGFLGQGSACETSGSRPLLTPAARKAFANMSTSNARSNPQATLVTFHNLCLWNSTKRTRQHAIRETKTKRAKESAKLALPCTAAVWRYFVVQGPTLCICRPERRHCTCSPDKSAPSRPNNLALALSRDLC